MNLLNPIPTPYIHTYKDTNLHEIMKSTGDIIYIICKKIWLIKIKEIIMKLRAKEIKWYLVWELTTIVKLIKPKRRR